MKKLTLLFVAVALSACGSKLDGTYTDKMGLTSLTFKSNGKVTQSTFGVEMETEYEIDDGKVKMKMPGGAATLVLTINEDGSLQGMMGTLVKSDNE